MLAMCLSGSNRSSLQARPRCHTVSFALSVDNTLKYLTVVNCFPFCDENMAALLSFIINKHGQKKADRHAYKCSAYAIGSKKRKKAREAKMGEGAVAANQETFKLLFTVAVKSSGDISAEPVRGQKSKEHVVTDLNLRNDDNRPSLTSNVAAEERQRESLKNTIDEMADTITASSDISLWSVNIPEEMQKYWLKNGRFSLTML